MNQEGYYTACHSNKEGLVPANFIQEIEVKNKKRFLSRIQELNNVSSSRFVLCEKMECLPSISYLCAIQYLPFILYVYLCLYMFNISVLVFLHYYFTCCVPFTLCALFQICVPFGSKKLPDITNMLI